MNAKQFLAEFRHIANAPGGTQRLREMVLQLAISGKLVDSSTTDSKIEEQLAEADYLKKVYEKDYSIRKTKKSHGIKASTYSIPFHWRWAQLDNISVYIQRGKGPKYTTFSDYKVVSQKCVQWSGFDLSRARYIKEDSLKSYGEERLLKNNDLLWNSTGTGTAGRVCLFDSSGKIEEKIVADSHVTIIRLANFNARYIWCVIASPWVQQKISPSHPGSLVSGTTQQVELNTSTVKSLLIPCPPIEEQVRIVAKVDELMVLCDQLEAQQQQKRKLQNQLRKSSLAAVAVVSSPLEFKQSWQRLQDHFDLLFSAPEDVTELRNLILDLAVAGKLSSYQEGDSDVLSLYQSIKAIQKDILSTREVKELQKLQVFERSKINRLKVALGHVVKVVSGQHLKPDEYNTSEVGIPYITGPAEFNLGRPSPTKWTENKRAVAKNGDILITVKGSGVGKTATCDLDALAISRQLMAIRPLGELNSKFLHLCIDSAEAKFQEQKTGIAIPGIGRDEVLSLSISLPSIEEQGRIVSFVLGLMKYCDVLESKLRSANKIAEQLVTASVANITGINIQQEEYSLKVPQTELVAPVTLGPNKPSSKDSAPLAALLSRQEGSMNANNLWQRFGGEIDAFYAQLKTEVENGWVAEPIDAKMLENETEK